MKIRQFKPKKNERVEFEGNSVKVLDVKPGKVTILNIYGYRQTVKPSQVAPVGEGQA